MRTYDEVGEYADKCRAAGNYGLVHPEKWLSERTSREPGARAVIAAMYRDYGAWCIAKRLPLGSRRMFSNWLVAQGVELGRGTGGQRIARGIALKLQPKP
jgi:hypothetical protein